MPTKDPSRRRPRARQATSLRNVHPGTGNPDTVTVYLEMARIICTFAGVNHQVSSEVFSERFRTKCGGSALCRGWTDGCCTISSWSIGKRWLEIFLFYSKKEYFRSWEEFCAVWVFVFSDFCVSTCDLAPKSWFTFYFVFPFLWKH